jgi:hypothetical protein
MTDYGAAVSQSNFAHPWRGMSGGFAPQRFRRAPLVALAARASDRTACKASAVRVGRDAAVI